jgi:hypothetical protein
MPLGVPAPNGGSVFMITSRIILQALLAAITLGSTARADAATRHFVGPVVVATSSCGVTASYQTVLSLTEKGASAVLRLRSGEWANLTKLERGAWRGVLLRRTVTGRQRIRILLRQSVGHSLTALIRSEVFEAGLQVPVCRTTERAALVNAPAEYKF